MSRNTQAYNTLKDLLTNICHLRHDEIALMMECIFRHLNNDDDDSANINHGLNQQAIKVKTKRRFKTIKTFFLSRNHLIFYIGLLIIIF
jgi:hypothetical protein